MLKQKVLQARNDSSSGFRFITTGRLQVPSMLKLVILQVRFKESEASLQGAVQSAVDPFLGFGNLFILNFPLFLQHERKLLPVPPWLRGLRMRFHLSIQSPEWGNPVLVGRTGLNGRWWGGRD